MTLSGQRWWMETGNNLIHACIVLLRLRGPPTLNLGNNLMIIHVVTSLSLTLRATRDTSQVVNYIETKLARSLLVLRCAIRSQHLLLPLICSL